MDEIKTIFIVEDSENDSWIAKRVIELSQLGNQLITCGDAEEALRQLDVHCTTHHCLPDLILVDIGLPVYDGIDLIGWIKKMPAYSPVKNLLVLVTEGLDSKYDLPRLQSEQIRYVIFKPLSQEKIEAIWLEFKKDI